MDTCLTCGGTIDAEAPRADVDGGIVHATPQDCIASLAARLAALEAP